jgi:trimeric autotransporter adhesin
LSITTTAATSAMSRPKNLFWPTAGGAVLALVVFFGIPARRRNWTAMLGLLVLFVSIGAIGCGGGGGNKGGGGGGGNSGTTAGTYTVTVTGTSGTITKTTAVTLTVQ